MVTTKSTVVSCRQPFLFSISFRTSSGSIDRLVCLRINGHETGPCTLHCHALRAHLLGMLEDHYQSGPRWPEGGNQGGQREDLAGQLYAVRSTILRSRDMPDRERRKSLRRKSVHVASIDTMI